LGHKLHICDEINVFNNTIFFYVISKSVIQNNWWWWKGHFINKWNRIWLSRLSDGCVLKMKIQHTICRNPGVYVPQDIKCIYIRQYADFPCLRTTRYESYIHPMICQNPYVLGPQDINHTYIRWYAKVPGFKDHLKKSQFNTLLTFSFLDEQWHVKEGQWNTHPSDNMQNPPGQLNCKPTSTWKQLYADKLDAKILVFKDRLTKIIYIQNRKHTVICRNPWISGLTAKIKQVNYTLSAFSLTIGIQKKEKKAYIYQIVCLILWERVF